MTYIPQTRNYTNLSKEQLASLRLIYEDFQYKSTTQWKEGPTSVLLSFPDPITLKTWDALLSKNGF